MTGTDLAPAQEIAALEGEMGQRGSDYWHSDEKQQRYRDLVSARDGHTKTPVAIVNPEAKEKRELERMMADRRSPYWRGPEADKLQARYRELIDPHTGLTSADAWRSTPEQARAALPATVVQEWDSSGDFGGKLRTCQDTYALVVTSIGDRETALEWEASFEALPSSVQAAIYAEAARGVPTFAKPADEAEMQNFVSVGGGAAECVKMWGAKAPQIVGRIYDRFVRAVSQMKPEDYPAFERWFDYSSPREKLSMLYALATV